MGPGAGAAGAVQHQYMYVGPGMLHTRKPRPRSHSGVRSDLVACWVSASRMILEHKIFLAMACAVAQYAKICRAPTGRPHTRSLIRVWSMHPHISDIPWPKCAPHIKGIPTFLKTHHHAAHMKRRDHMPRAYTGGYICPRTLVAYVLRTPPAWRLQPDRQT